jgi:hypothetical protein
MAAHRSFGATVVLDFDELHGMSYYTGTAVPSGSRLSDGFLETHGVVFRSEDVPYVAVVNLNSDFLQAPSAPNGIGGVGPGNVLDYAAPIIVEFFVPGRPEAKGSTDFVSVTTDVRGDGNTILVNAFDASGALVASARAVDRDGPTLVVSVPGIHSIEIRGQWGTSFDDLKFNLISRGAPFLRGDSNGDRLRDLTDALAIMGCLFLGTPCGDCPPSRDVNDDGFLNIVDPIFLLQWLFLGGAGPPAPSEQCGLDFTRDGLDECRDYPACQ